MVYAMVDPTLPAPMITALLLDDNVSICCYLSENKIQKINPFYYNTNFKFVKAFLIQNVNFLSYFAGKLFL
jgi:hypothetical protein